MVGWLHGYDLVGDELVEFGLVDVAAAFEALAAHDLLLESFV